MKKIFTILITIFALPLLVFADEPTECIMSYKVTTTKSVTVYKGMYDSSDFNPQSANITMAAGTTLDIINEVIYKDKVYLGFSVNDENGNFSLKTLDENYKGGYAGFGCGDYDAYYVLLSDVKFISMNMKDSYFYQDNKPYESKEYIILTDNVVLHTEPSTFAPKVDGVANLPKDFEFTCLKENELFCQTTYQGKTGWVYLGNKPKEEHAFAKIKSEEFYRVAEYDENIYSDMNLTKKIGIIPDMRIFKVKGTSSSGFKTIAKIEYDNIEGYIDFTNDRCDNILEDVYTNGEMYLYKDFEKINGEYALEDKITIEAGTSIEEVNFLCSNEKLMVVKYNGDYYYTDNNRSIISEKTNDKIATNHGSNENHNTIQNYVTQENIIYIVGGLSLIVIVLVVIIIVVVKKNRKLKNNLNS